MPRFIDLPSFADQRGDLTVLENEIGFPMERLFFITNVPESQTRGGHGHFITRQFLICLNGSCSVTVRKKNYLENFLLNCSNRGLLLEPEDWHQMTGFKHGTVLLVVSSRKYDPNDYFTTPEA